MTDGRADGQSAVCNVANSGNITAKTELSW